jgi:hypothetical protein
MPHMLHRDTAGIYRREPFFALCVLITVLDPWGA